MRGLAVPSSAKHLVTLGCSTLSPSASLESARGTAANPPPSRQCHRLAAQAVADRFDLEHVHGWAVSLKKGKGVGTWRVVFEHHSCVRDVRSGELLCPSTPAGEWLDFLPDPRRASNLDDSLFWNAQLIANYSLQGRLQTRAAPFKLTQFAPFGDDYVFSTDARHARWVLATARDPFEFARLEGLNTGSLRDLAFCCDLDSVVRAWTGTSLDEMTAAEALITLRKVVEATRQRRTCA